MTKDQNIIHKFERIQENKMIRMTRRYEMRSKQMINLLLFSGSTYLQTSHVSVCRMLRYHRSKAIKGDQQISMENHGWKRSFSSVVPERTQILRHTFSEMIFLPLLHRFSRTLKQKNKIIKRHVNLACQSNYISRSYISASLCHANSNMTSIKTSVTQQRIDHDSETCPRR